MFGFCSVTEIYPLLLRCLKKHNLKHGQAAMQYIMMLGIASVAVLGIVQSRFTKFQQGMESVKQEMALIIGGSKRLPERWYSKEKEDYSAAVKSLKKSNRSGPLEAEAGDEAGFEGPKYSDQGRGPAEEVGEEVGDGGGSSKPSTAGSGFYGGSQDSGFKQSSSQDAGAGTLGGKKKKKGKKGGGNYDSGSDDAYDELYDEDDGGYLGEEKKLAAKKAKEEEEKVKGPGPKKAEAEAEDEEGGKASVKKTKNTKEEERKGGKMKLDWATIVKLILIIAIIVILVILLLGSVGAKSDD
jgi:hypothetical protein